MKLDKIFSFLVPKDRKFFPLFNDAADNLVLASELLIKLVRERDLTQRLEYMKSIKDVEHVGDDITRNLLNELNGTFITPFDREDIHELINNMDDIVDYIHAASKKLRLINYRSLWVMEPIMTKLSLCLKTTVVSGKTVTMPKNCSA